MTVTLLLVVAAFVSAVVSALGKCPLWISVIFLCVVEALQVMPK